MLIPLQQSVLEEGFQGLPGSQQSKCKKSWPPHSSEHPVGLHRERHTVARTSTEWTTLSTLKTYPHKTYPFIYMMIVLTIVAHEDCGASRNLCRSCGLGLLLFSEEQLHSQNCHYNSMKSSRIYRMHI